MKKFDDRKKTKKQRLPLSFFTTLFTTLIFICITIFTLIIKGRKNEILFYFTLAFAIIYSLVFIGFIIYALNKKENVSTDMKNMKFAGKTFKTSFSIAAKSILLVNIVAGFANSIIEYQALRADNKRISILLVFSLIGAFLSLFSTVLFIIKKSRKIVKSSKKRQKQIEKENQKKNKKIK